MSPNNVYDYFKICFPTYAESVETWFPNGKNRIRVRLINKYDFIFTYNNNRDWCFETVDSFIARTKGDKKM